MNLNSAELRSESYLRLVPSTTFILPCPSIWSEPSKRSLWLRNVKLSPWGSKALTSPTSFPFSGFSLNLITLVIKIGGGFTFTSAPNLNILGDVGMTRFVVLGLI